MSTVTGGCFCGQVRIEVQGPEKYACFCHCESCQRAAGAPVVAWATYARDTFNSAEMARAYQRCYERVINGEMLNTAEPYADTNLHEPLPLR